ncbi:MAG: MiaB/RimO family radical SAM methylthiotransferase [Desulfonatronovibrionaceae bacterium]
MDASKSFFPITLGCKINQYETQALIETWETAGLKCRQSAKEADIVLVNSCAVTARAVRDTRKAIRKAAAENPMAGIIVTGCAARAFGPEFSAMPEVSRVVSQEKKYSLSPGKEKDNLDLEISGFFRARAPVRVQDGCSHCCTYCIVPRTRGRARSRPLEKVLPEVNRILSAGIREISLCGTNLRQYGRDLDPKLDFWDLVRSLRDALHTEWSGRARFRLSSLEPSELTAKGLKTLDRCSDMLCPHLHISLQSASPAVLKDMGRGHYHPEQLAEFCRSLKNVWPVFALGADLLLGFPGEEHRLFCETRDFVDKIPFTYAHIFPFSPRPGTPAAGFSSRVDPEETRARCQELQELIKKKKLSFQRGLLHLPRVHPVLETRDAGTNEFFVPTRLEGRIFALGRKSIVPAVPVRFKDGTLTAEVCI